MSTNARRTLWLLLLAPLALACSGTGSPTDSATAPNLGTSAATAGTITGTVSGVDGTCPVIAFALEGKKIRTDASTAFRDLTCAAVKAGVRVEVTGTANAEGTVLATAVRPAATTTPTTPVTPVTPTVYSGVVASVTGTCPVLKIMLGERTITTTSATAFTGMGCGDIRAGVTVEATGALASTGVLAATGVVSKK